MQQLVLANIIAGKKVNFEVFVNHSDVRTLRYTSNDVSDYNLGAYNF